MTNVIETIIADLNTILADFDAKNAEASREWAKGRKAAMAEFRAGHCVFKDGDKVRLDQHTFYQKLFALAGGKTWYNVFQGRNEAMVNEIMDKNSAAIVAKRNALIAKKLAGNGINSVEGFEPRFSEGAFNCIIYINTDLGLRRVEIETIVAGGYNIQCLHNRTLVKVR